MHSDQRWRPHEVLALTPAELALAMDADDKPAGRDSRPPGVSVGQWAAYWRSLTPQQRVERARRRWKEA